MTLYFNNSRRTVQCESYHVIGRIRFRFFLNDPKIMTGEVPAKLPAAE